MLLILLTNDSSKLVPLRFFFHRLIHLTLMPLLLLPCKWYCAGLEVKAEVVNPTPQIQDGAIYITVSGGEAPYKYYWSLNHVPLDYAVAEGIDEGTQVTVIVTDALNRSQRISTMIPAESLSEKLNAIFIPLVDLLSAVFLWDPFSAIGIYDPIVYNSSGDVLRYPNGDAVMQNCWLVVVLLIGAAFWFTLYLRGINFRGFRHGFALLSGKFAKSSDKGEVSQFQALSAALSGTLGLGNISLVAVAIALGGPGATFWMIVAGVLGMSSKFVECTLGVKYRKISVDGEVSGGPMYYLSEGLSRKGWPRLGRFLAVAFAVMCVGGTLGGGNMIQANQAFAQVRETLGDDTSAMGFGIVMALAIGIVIAGGIKSIAGLTQRLIPAAVLVYVVFALIIIGMNITRVGEAFVSIFNGAFQPDAMKGGFIGVMMMGFRRASFSNEAGIGSASIAHSASKTNKPVSEGFVALLEPFIDTVVVCTMTALVLVFTGYADNPGGLTGSALTNAAFTSVFPWFDWVLMIAIIVFAYATMISWSYYGMKSWSYLWGEKWYVKQSFNLLFIICTVIGTVSSLGAVVDFSDMMILGMAFPNLIGLFMLQSEVKADLKVYWEELKRSKGVEDSVNE
jgi:AGCS family alanine or glycine:cation symporter